MLVIVAAEVVAWVFLTSAWQVLANDTAMHEGANGPEPLGWRSGGDGESVIAMREEMIIVHFGIKRSHVRAQFTMVCSKKGSDARQTLGFPDLARSWYGMDSAVSGPIEELATRVNGKLVEAGFQSARYETTYDEDGSILERRPARDASGDVFAWHSIEVTFPPGRPVLIEREYDVPNGATAGLGSFFVYETMTGSNWDGPIGRLVAVVDFAEDVDLERIRLSPRQGWILDKATRTAELVWRNFEPRDEPERRSFRILLLDPHAPPDAEM